MPDVHWQRIGEEPVDRDAAFVAVKVATSMIEEVTEIAALGEKIAAVLAGEPAGQVFGALFMLVLFEIKSAPPDIQPGLKLTLTKALENLDKAPAPDHKKGPEPE
jgi:hypothetical protein